MLPFHRPFTFHQEMLSFPRVPSHPLSSFQSSDPLPLTSETSIHQILSLHKENDGLSSDPLMPATSKSIRVNIHDGDCQFKVPCGLNLRESWIAWKLEDILWIPHEYRSDVTAVRNDLIIMGLRSGRLEFIRFDLESIPCSTRPAIEWQMFSPLTLCQVTT